jgi:hypothetical protein
MDRTFDEEIDQSTLEGEMRSLSNSRSRGALVPYSPNKNEAGEEIGVIGKGPGGVSLPPIKSSFIHHPFNKNCNIGNPQQLKKGESRSSSFLMKEASVKKMFSLMPLGDIDKYDRDSTTNVLSQQKSLFKNKATGVTQGGVNTTASVTGGGGVNNTILGGPAGGGCQNTGSLVEMMSNFSGK